MSAADKRKFMCLPSGLIGDKRLDATDIRVLCVIALHDGMSHAKGKGAGCFAAYSTLAKLVGIDITAFSRSVTKLLRTGYVLREPQIMDKRRYTLFVVYEGLSPNLVGKDDNNAPEIVDKYVNNDAEIVDKVFCEDPRKAGVWDMHYISLNEGLNSAKQGTISPLKGALLKLPDAHGIGKSITANSLGLNLKADKRNTRERGLPGCASLKPYLSDTFDRLSTEAQLCRFEEAFQSIGRKADELEKIERTAWANWLFAVSEENSKAPVGRQAQRLFEEVAAW